MTLHIQGTIENIRKLESMGVREGKGGKGERGKSEWVRIDTEIKLEWFLILRLLINWIQLLNGFKFLLPKCSIARVTSQAPIRWIQGMPGVGMMYQRSGVSRRWACSLITVARFCRENVCNNVSIDGNTSTGTMSTKVYGQIARFFQELRLAVPDMACKRSFNARSKCTGNLAIGSLKLAEEW